MSQSNIDTLKTYEDLIASGIPDSQAKAHVKALNKSLDGLATKDDLKATEAFLKQELTIVKSDIKSDIAFMVMLPIIIAFAAQILLKKKGWI